MEYPGDDGSHSGVRTPECSRQLPSLPSCHSEQGCGFEPNHCFPHGNLVDFDFPNKTNGHLVHADTSFWFVGPDRDLVQIDLVQKCLEVADIILGTGLPNYKMARTPIKSGLHLRAWEEQLIDYPDQRLLQYLTPVSEVNHPAFHYSPLLTRPKDGSKRRVIMDLSYPTGNAVNDFVHFVRMSSMVHSLHFVFLPLMIVQMI